MSPVFSPEPRLMELEPLIAILSLFLEGDVGVGAGTGGVGGNASIVSSLSVEQEPKPK